MASAGVVLTTPNVKAQDPEVLRFGWTSWNPSRAKRLDALSAARLGFRPEQAPFVDCAWRTGHGVRR